MGDSTYYADGQWNVTCDLCAKKIKSSHAVKTWDNFYVCRHHKEVRNPQDYLRGVKDNQSVPFSRPENTNWQFVLPQDRLLQENGFGLLLQTTFFNDNDIEYLLH
jgi:hypothetical protein